MTGRSHRRNVFFGSAGLRAVWRLLIFLAVTFVCTVVLVNLAAFTVARATHVPLTRLLGSLGQLHLSPGLVALVDGPIFVATLIATAVLARIERRSIGDYGLPLRRPAAARAFEGGCAAVVTLGFVIAALFASGHLAFAATEASAGWAALWLGAFIVLGLSEEYSFRGYALITLAGGRMQTASPLRFWLAALLLSAGFAAAHAPNPGETPAGIAGTFGFALLLCWITRWSGSLWFAVGFHTGWDWAETYVFGVPDSGLAAQHTLVAARFAGPDWLTGGTAGPEGAVPVWLALAVVALYAHRRFAGHARVKATSVPAS